MNLRSTARTLALAGVAGLALATAASAAAGMHSGRALPVKPFHVHGTIGLADNTATHTLTVRLRLSGFTPNTRHVMHIHQGLLCAAMVSGAMPMPTMGKILVPLGIHTADAHGQMNETFTVKTRAKINFGAIHVMVHHGPTISTAVGARPVTCADIA